MGGMNRHATAVIHEATRLPESVHIGAYAVIEDGVEMGDGCVVREHAVVRCGSVLGEGCVVDAHAVVGGLPQDLGFHPGTPSGVRLGNKVILREGVTINRATVEGGFTELGDGCYLMAGAHVGHDCELGEHVILANDVLLAGKVRMGGHVFAGGAAVFHQYCRVGESAMISGASRVSQDVPAFCMMAERNELVGLNLVGLRRRGLERETLAELKKLYRLVFATAGRPGVLAEGLLKDGVAKTAEGVRFLEFLEGESRQGVMRPRKERKAGVAR